MRIGIFTSDFARKGPFESEEVSWGGVGEATYHLAMGLNDKGHQVEVATIGPCNRRTTFEEITLREYNSELSISGSPLSIQFLYDYRGEPLDIIHIHRGSPSGAIAGYIHAKRSNTPYIFTVHGDLHFPDRSHVRNILLEAFNKVSSFILRDAEYITTVSDTFRRNSNYLNNFRNETTVVPNGIGLPDNNTTDSGKFGLPLNNSYPIILYLGALVPRKNPRALVDAAPKILNEYPNALFIIAGDGKQSDELIDKAKTEAISNKIIFPGFIPENQKQNLFQTADLFCLPSRNESFGLTAFEAAANGLPIILGDIPIFRELFEQSASYVTPGDCGEISSAILDLLENDSKRNRLSRQAQEQAARYSWGEVVNQYLNLYRDVLEGR
jgi:glycosyltransferase involved in cell wall biosynthesis